MKDTIPLNGMASIGTLFVFYKILNQINMRKIIEKKHLQKAMDYDSYRKLVDELLQEGKTTGPKQSEQLTEYATKNVATMQKIENTFQVDPEIENLINSVTQPQTWIVLTEGWCKDAAHTVPVLNALAKLNSNIELKLLLRDENLDLMDQYLTNGKNRSIPKLIAVNPEIMEEIFHWGPSQVIQQSSPEEKTIITQKEICDLVAQPV
ncbi:MAG: thioredoxin family protein [Chitinophagaceae bacterium]|nr:MAG: thioredoxin family protein [Chitinophagaceae bacterium]